MNRSSFPRPASSIWALVSKSTRTHAGGCLAIYIFRALLCLAFGVVECGQLQAEPRLEWARAYKFDAAKVNQAGAIGLYPDGSIAVAGSSAGASGDLDYVLIKYSPAGEQLWLQRFDSGGADQFRKMAVDASGNATLTGTSKTVRFDSEGNLRWVQPYGARDILVDSNFVYVTGFSDQDITTAKLQGSNGTNIWTQTVNGQANSTDVSQALALDSGGNVYVGGTETWFCDASGCYQLIDLFKYGPNGAILATHQYSYLNAGRDTRVNLTKLLLRKDGHVLLVGDNGYRGFHFWTLDFASDFQNGWTWSLDIDDQLAARAGTTGDALIDGSGNILIVGGHSEFPYALLNTVKIKPDGHKAWRNEAVDAFPKAEFGTALSLDKAGNVLVTGCGLIEGSATDMVILKYDKDGVVVWRQWYDGAAHKSDYPAGVACGDSGELYVTGYSETAEGGSEFVTVKYSEAPKIEKKADGTTHLEFMTAPSSAFALEATLNFFDWSSLITNTADASGLVQFDDLPSPNIPYRFYRGKRAQ